MKNKRTLKIAGGIVLLAVSAGLYVQLPKENQNPITKTSTQRVPKVTLTEVKSPEQISPDDLLLSIVKNDKQTIQKHLSNGGSLETELPAVDGKVMNLAEAIVYHGKTELIREIQKQDKKFVQANSDKNYDVLTLAVVNNNKEALKLLLQEKPAMDRSYGEKGYALIHMASAQCLPEMVKLLETSGQKWDQKAQDGSTALTVAAEKGCLPVLSYLKEKGADFKQADGRGKSALDILKTKKDAAVVSFTKALLPQKKTTADLELSDDTPNFYKKKRVPKFQLADKDYAYEPEDRPDGSYQTADYAEFSD